MFVLSSARLPRLSRLQPLARQRGTGTRFQPHSGLLWGEGKTSRFLGPRAFSLESLEWAGWCRSSKNSDRAQKARPSQVQPETPVHPPGLGFLRAPIPELLSGNKCHPSPCLSPRTDAFGGSVPRLCGDLAAARVPGSHWGCGAGGGSGLPGAGEKGAGPSGQRCWTGCQAS